MNFDISGFHADFIPGNKSRNAIRGRHSGGLAVYYKDYLKNYITIVKKEQSGILWVKISEDLFPFDQDVFMCNIYVPPTDSKVFNSTNIDLYDMLEQLSSTSFKTVLNLSKFIYYAMKIRIS